eukprot:4805360-Pleurochrysis_carterae.AAC.3
MFSREPSARPHRMKLRARPVRASCMLPDTMPTPPLGSALARAKLLRPNLLSALLPLRRAALGNHCPPGRSQASVGSHLSVEMHARYSHCYLGGLQTVL